ncbi:hypothetical protein J6590_028986 [Homalodisca vitripennis]|nr:hypothetical protein J6590_028986 [Homalodisca vitripennis]
MSCKKIEKQTTVTIMNITSRSRHSSCGEVHSEASGRGNSAHKVGGGVFIQYHHVVGFTLKPQVVETGERNKLISAHKVGGGVFIQYHHVVRYTLKPQVVETGKRNTLISAQKYINVLRFTLKPKVVEANQCSEGWWGGGGVYTVPSCGGVHSEASGHGNIEQNKLISAQKVGGEGGVHTVPSCGGVHSEASGRGNKGRGVLIQYHHVVGFTLKPQVVETSERNKLISAHKVGEGEGGVHTVPSCGEVHSEASGRGNKLASGRGGVHTVPSCVEVHSEASGRGKRGRGVFIQYHHVVGFTLKPEVVETSERNKLIIAHKYHHVVRFTLKPRVVETIERSKLISAHKVGEGEGCVHTVPSCGGVHSEASGRGNNAYKVGDGEGGCSYSTISQRAMCSHSHRPIVIWGVLLTTHISRDVTSGYRCHVSGIISNSGETRKVDLAS